MASNPGKDANESDVTTAVEEPLDFGDDLLRAKAEVYRNQGNEEYTKRNFKNAVHFYTEGIKVNCKDKELKAKLHSNRALAHFYFGNYHESLSDSKRATELQPAYLKAIVRGASACVELKQFEEAITWCDKGLALDEHNKVLLELKATSVIGNIELQQKDEKEVKEELETTSGKGKGEGNTENETTVTVDKALDCDDDCLREKAEAYKNKGNDEYGKKNFSNAIRLYTEGIKVNCKDKELNAKLYSNRAIAYFYLGNYYDSLSDAKAATELQPNFLKAFIRGASACVQLNQFEEAIAWCDKGLAISNTNRQLLDLRATSVKEQTNSQNTDGVKEQETPRPQTGNDSSLENPIKAKEYYSRRLQIAQDEQDTGGIGQAYGNLGNVYDSLGDHKTAIEYHKLSILCAREVRDRASEAGSYGNIGISFERLGDCRKAVQYYNLHLSIAKEIGDKKGEACAYGNLGNAFQRLGDLKKAIEYHELSLSVCKDIGDKKKEERAYGNLAIVFTSLGDCSKAIDYCNRHLAIAKEIGDRIGEGYTYANLGMAFFSRGDFQQAVHYHTLCLQVVKEVGDKTGERRAYNNLCNAYFRLGDFTNAMHYNKLRLEMDRGVGGT
ncbi:tetratricopeptide repeat protein 28-like [Orbicella faveolata]|uniref:tetratricopeptide repeat protein 28-like n=1 Tax=Orbicella faveolata TaxID=48498 RepID=UPI0009E2C42B|nr:tetratricopeptide repeat protein 28-like [Orbicella faveolata]